MSFWVVGGIYKDTKFKELAEGQKLEKYGPFKEYSEARQKWDYHSLMTMMILPQLYYLE